jgi:hypothetical protein
MLWSIKTTTSQKRGYKEIGEELRVEYCIEDMLDGGQV